MNAPRTLGAQALLLAAVALAGCGGGGDDEPPTGPAVCYVDGKPMPSEVCR